MLAPKSWLSDFVSLSGISDEQFAREMTFAGNKVESVQKVDGETIYEFEITSNRPDTLSIIGLAREAAAVFDRQLKHPPLPKKKNLKQLPIKLTVRNKIICPVFSVVELNHITVKPSSHTVRKRLEAAGIRPINNVADITNYVMLETGQPMHAFDADKLRGPLVMRAAKPGERITTIDHKKRILSDVEYVIEDQERLVHLAGLMGEVNSEISEKTTRIYLHVPVYDPVSVRRASKHLRLRTEGSTRFEKKLDLTQTESAALRAIELLEKETGGKQTTIIVTSKGSDLSARSDPSRYITLSRDAITKLVGIPFSEHDINLLLIKIGIEKTSRGYLIPSWRRDITIPADLVEEVTRLHGYNKLPRTLPIGKIPINTDALTPNWKRIVAERCVALGYTETYASTLIGKQIIEELGFYSPKEHLKVLHPMSEDFEYMRRTTLETLIPFLKQNLLETRSFVLRSKILLRRINFQEINIFELGTVFIPTEKTSDLPDQPLELGLISTTCSYAEFKGHIENIGTSLGVAFTFTPTQSTQANKHPSLINSIEVNVNNSPRPRGDKSIIIKPIGYIGTISPHLLEKTDVIAYVGQLNMTEVFNHATKSFTYPQLSNYPPIIEDLTLERPTGKYLGDALSIIKNISPLVRRVDYLGEYQNFVSLRVTYQSFDRSLTQEKVRVIREDILKKLEPFGWKLKLTAGLE